MTDCGPPPTQPPDRASSGGGDRLGALSAPATGSSSSTSTSPAAVAAATTALGILTSGSSYGGNSANVHLHGLHSVHAAHAAAQNQHHHPDYPPTTSLSRNGSLGSVGFRSSLMGSSPQQQAGGPGPHGLWGHSAAGTPSAVPLLSPAELAEAADGSIHNSDSIQVLLAQMRQRVQAEQQQQQQAKSELHFQTKKRSRTMMMESNSNNTNTNTNNDSASISSLDNSQNKGSTSSSSSYLGRGGAAAAAELLRANSAPLGASSPGLTSLLAMQSGGSIASLNSALSGLGGNAGAGNAAAAAANNVSMAQLEQLVRKQQQRQGLQQFKQLKQMEEMQRIAQAAGAGPHIPVSRDSILRQNALLQFMLQQQQQQNSAVQSSNAVIETQIKALEAAQRQQQQAVQRAASNFGGSGHGNNGDKQRNKLSSALEESAVANFMMKNSAANNANKNSGGLARLNSAQIQQMMVSRQLLQQNQQQQQQLVGNDGMPPPPSLISAVSSMDSVGIMQMLLPKNRQQHNQNNVQNAHGLENGGRNSANASALVPTTLNSSVSSPVSALHANLNASLLTPMPFPPVGGLQGLGLLGGLSGSAASGLSGMITVARPGGNNASIQKAGLAAHMNGGSVSLHPSTTDLVYEQRRLAAAAEVSNTVRDSSVGKPPDAFVDRDHDGRARDLPTLLVVPMDHMQLSSHQTLLRYQIEVFRAGEEDTSTHTRGRNKPVQLGQIGIRCRHCKVLPVCRRKRGSVYFPRAVEGFYQAAQNMNSTHLQTGECPLMGEALRREFANLIATRGVSTGAGRAYWAKQARKLGLRNTESGIVFDKIRPEQGDGSVDANNNNASSKPSNNKSNIV